MILLSLLINPVHPGRVCAEEAVAGEKDQAVRFDINEIQVQGNTLMPEESVKQITASFTGKGKTSDDVEKLRVTLEKAYRETGYPTVQVNIPEQNVEGGVIVFDVVEARIGQVQVNGNRYFTMEKILGDLPVFAPGEILYLPRAQQELNTINMNPDLKVKPVLMPGQVPGTVDVELVVTDKMPLHGSLELNNRASANTSALRVNGVIHYDNLWQKEHSLSVQFQTSPEDMDEVKALSLSYMIHAPWNANHLLALYSVFSDSETAFGEGFKVNGEGYIAGVRYVIPLPGSSRYGHNVTLGVDYKKFKDSLYFGDAEDKEEEDKVDITPVGYSPLSFAYQGSVMNKDSRTTVNAGLNMVLRGTAMDVEEYENKRYKARGNYIAFKTGVEHATALPGEFGLNLKIDAQITDQPLISNEQVSAGGMESVRGYRESEVSGDNTVCSSLEIAFPELFTWLGKRSGGTDGSKAQRYKFRPYVFYDMAYLRLKDPLPGEDQPGMIQGTGVGFRGYVTRYFNYGLDWGMALNRTDGTDAGDGRVYFRGKWAF
jgi:hemolysin activation/secretion protein